MVAIINCSIFAYGQTGSGKTYTMFGHGDEDLPGGSFTVDKDAGLAPRVACELFQLVEERKASFDVIVKMNMFEVSVDSKHGEHSYIWMDLELLNYNNDIFKLYNDNIRDLMTNSNSKNKNDDVSLRIKLAEHSDSGLVEVSGAVSKDVENVSQLLRLFRRGSEFRTTASTKMNADSSRSHLITSITVTLTNKRTNHVTHGKMTLVDLAGSERVGKR